MNHRLLIRLARMARRRRSPGQIRMMLVIAGLIAALMLIEHFVGWPDWATVNRLPR